MLQPSDHHYIGDRDPGLLFHVRMVHYQSQRTGIEDVIFPFCIFYGGSVSDGHVHPSQTADSLKLNTPWNIWIIYLGFGAGLAVFMFAGFMKSIPLEIEEASMIDGCNPIQTFFLIVLPILKPTLVSVGILEAMWVWNDYLLPTLVLDIKKYKTIPMLIQYFRGSYGKVEMGPMMASIMLTVIPIVIVYLLGQKHIIKGIAAGAVKG